MLSLPEEYQILEKGIVKEPEFLEIFKMACDQQGTHVLQKLVFVESISNFLLENMLELCKDTRGLSAVKKLIATAKDK